MTAGYTVAALAPAFQNGRPGRRGRRPRAGIVRPLVMRFPWLPMRSLVAPRPPAPIYADRDIPRLRAAGRFNAELLDHLRPFVAPGITTRELDQIAHEF